AFVLDGVLLADTTLGFEGTFGEARIRHCGLYVGPGADGALGLGPFDGCLGIESSVVHGTIHVRPEPASELCDPATYRRPAPAVPAEVTVPPARVVIADSILDGSRFDGSVALAGWQGERTGPPATDALARHPPGHVALTVLRCTVFGHVNVHALDLAED